jgi:hypothetical protein
MLSESLRGTIMMHNVCSVCYTVVNLSFRPKSWTVEGNIVAVR